jgi:hypothetical protein
LREDLRNLDLIARRDRRVMSPAHSLAGQVTLRRPITLGFVWDIETRMLVFFLVIDSTRAPTVAFGLELFQEPDENDLKFARSYGRKFNDDLRAAPEVKKQ